MANPKRTSSKKIKIVLFFIINTLIVCGIYLLLKLDTFNLVDVEIIGTERYEKPEILSALNLKKGENIFLNYINMNKGEIKELPYLENIIVEFSSYNTLKISTSERISKYVAFNKEKNEYYRIDFNGYILEKISNEDRTKTELLTYGIGFDDEVTLGIKLNEIYVSKFKVYEEIASCLIENDIKDNITLVNFENSLTTITLNDKLNIIFPNDDNLKYKVDTLKEILKNLGEDAKGTLDLTITNPIFSTDY